MDIKKALREHEAVPGFVCPAEFWPALGYEGTARHVAIYWEPCGDEACYSDGHTTLVGATWPAYWALMDYNFPPSHPVNRLLGSSETSAICWLVVDRYTEWAWLVPSDQAGSILRAQHPSLIIGAPIGNSEGLSFEEWLATLTLLTVPTLATTEDVEALMAAETAHYVALVEALERRRAAANPSVKIA